MGGERAGGPLGIGELDDDLDTVKVAFCVASLTGGERGWMGRLILVVSMRKNLRKAEDVDVPAWAKTALKATKATRMVRENMVENWSWS